MERKEQIQYFIPSISVSFMITVADDYMSTFFKYTCMPAVPRAGDQLRLLINKKEYWLIVETVEYVEEKCSYEIDLEDVSNEKGILSNLREDPNWN